MEKFLSIVRHTLTFAGGVLVMQGTIDQGMATEVTGATITFIGAVWGVWEKFRRP